MPLRAQKFEDDPILKDMNHVFCEEIFSELPLWIYNRFKVDKMSILYSYFLQFHK